MGVFVPLVYLNIDNLNQTATYPSVPSNYCNSCPCFTLDASVSWKLPFHGIVNQFLDQRCLRHLQQHSQQQSFMTWRCSSWVTSGRDPNPLKCTGVDHAQSKVLEGQVQTTPPGRRTWKELHMTRENVTNAFQC
jgi:hypothetical protein